LKKNKNNTLDYCYYYFLSCPPVPHLYSAHLILLQTVEFLRRRKEMISTEEESLTHADIPKERGVV
jgi:hypothetical protein